MSYYSNAISKLKGYDTAIEKINLTKEELSNAKSELTKIKGFQKCTNLENNISDRIEYLEGEIKDIEEQKNAILQRARYLDQEAERIKKELLLKKQNLNK